MSSVVLVEDEASPTEGGNSVRVEGRSAPSGGGVVGGIGEVEGVGGVITRIGGGAARPAIG